MKQKRLAFILSLSWIISGYVLGQVRVIDNVDGRIVPYAQIMDEKGVTIGFVDANGIFPENINKGKVTIQHMSYYPKEIECSKFRKDTCISLTPRDYMLDEVEITSKANDYIHLRTYFRSYQLNDSCLKYFKDGFADFFIRLKSRKVKRFVTQTRVLANEKMISEDKKHANMLVDKYITTPSLGNGTLLEELKEDGCSYQPDSTLAYLYDDGIRVGSVEKDTKNGVCVVTYDALEGKGEKKGTLFGYTTRLVYNYQTEVYRNLNEYKSFIDLLCKKGYRKLFYRYKKDPKEQMVEVMDELYVLKGEYISSDRMKDVISDLKLAENKESVENLIIPPLNEHFSFVLKTEMMPIK